MLIKVFQDLNTRVGGPGRTFKKGTVRLPGEQIEVLCKVPGEEIDNNAEWYFDGNENYYWSGGANEVTATVAAPAPPPARAAAPSPQLAEDPQTYISSRFDGTLLQPIDYSFLLNIDGSVKQTAGNGVTVGILDHAIASGIPFQHNVVRTIDVGQPQVSHGSFVAGMIAGIQGVKGVAPGITLMSLPMMDAQGFILTPEQINSLLSLAMQQPAPFVLNISRAMDPGFTQAITAMTSKIIVASAGTDADLVQPQLIFPARLPNVLAVGCVSSSFRQQNPQPAFNPALDFVLPNFTYVSNSVTSGSGYETASGDSFSAAVVTGLIALLIAAGRINPTLTNGNLDQVRQALRAISQPYSDPNSFHTFNCINPSS